VPVETRAAPSADWNSFVAGREDASLYHRAEWTGFIGRVFGQQTWFVEARDAQGRLTGVLPLVRQRGPVFGSFMTSLPYFNYGGALAESDDAALAMMAQAEHLARQVGCRYLELRDIRPRGGGWTLRTDKVSMVLDLPPDSQSLGSALGAKLRSQARRPKKEGAQVVVGGIGQVDAFYDVFSRNMHALGTPVYPRRFFRALVERFPDNAVIVIVSQGGTPQSAGFLLVDGRTAEIPWAACREDAKPRGYNMKLYLACLTHAIERGCVRFDFGRSTVDSGTYRFKAQWGAKPVQLYWHRWQAAGDKPQRGAGGGNLRDRVAGLWKALPLPLANALGPLVSPRLPW
jgi:serine/alanine adding enzyme